MSGAIAVTNLDLLGLGIVAAALIIVGTSVLMTDPKNASFKAFFLLTFVSVAWSCFNFSIYKSSDPVTVLWLLRGLMFSAAWFALGLFNFFLVFPKREYAYPQWFLLLLLPATTVVSLMTLTPLVFHNVGSFSVGGQVQDVTNGPGIYAFGILVMPLVISSIALLLYKTQHASPDEKRPYNLVLSGTVMTFALVLMFNFIFPAFLGISRLVIFGTVFLIPFILLTSIAILRHKLFNIKVAGAGALVFSLCALMFVEIVLSDDVYMILFRVSVLILVLMFGIQLIRSVLREVQQREQIEEQRRELQSANSQQESLLHFISHEIKGYLTKGEAAFAEISEETNGQQTPIHSISETALVEMRKGVSTVMDILDASNLRKGTVAFKRAPFNFKTTVEKSIEALRSNADEKKLTIDVQIDGASFGMVGDEEKLREHVVRNLIDNAIRYTPAGHIKVSLAQAKNGARLTVEDSGVGITPDDMTRLFTEGGHGKDSIKVNVHSTGYGLFIAKQVVDAHKGKIWAESDGAGKGSRFIVELPTV